jgi:PelA/Pel-15E family pectate lyase
MDFRPAGFAVLLLLPVVVYAARSPRSWEPDPFKPLSAERIAALPDAERASWMTYWDRSERLMQQLSERPRADRSLLQPMSTPPKGGVHSKGLRDKADASWYASEEAHEVADRVAAAQLEIGAWGKGVNYAAPLDSQSLPRASPTFDNNATTSELRHLAAVIAASPAHEHAAIWRASFEKGVRYILDAQYPNGGYPQIYPLAGGYHDGITFNDDAMTRILELLRDIASGRGAFGHVSPELQRAAGEALRRGVACVLSTQLRDANGHLTCWAQQYDALTLQPAAARNFEPIADASRESAGITRLLMSLPNPSPDVIAAVDGAVAWFQRTALHDLKIASAPKDSRGGVVASPGAGPLWARFYERGTTTPIFGDRDRTVHYDLAEVSPERVAGYAWYTAAPAAVLQKYKSWQKRR